MERKTIGIDLGHCETAVAIPRLVKDENGSRYEVRRLIVRNKDQVISTQIILTNAQMEKLAGHNRPSYSLLSQLGEIQIGNNLSAYVPDGEKFCYFKVAPKYFNESCGNTDSAKRNKITHGILMACFAFALVNDVFKYNDGDISENERKDVDLLIGCPTTNDWTSSESQQAYAALVKKATNVHDVRIIPESRAAMFSSVEHEKNKISALKGAMVFDFGSLTADCTYMLLGRKIIEFSWELGASKIERQMTMAAHKQAQETNGPFKTKATSFVDVEDNLRTAKEFYYSHKYPPHGHPMICAFEKDKGGFVNQAICIDDNYMQQIIEGTSIEVLCDSKTLKKGTWKELCEQFFDDAKNRVGNATFMMEDDSGNRKAMKCTIDNIVLTGGASGMDFVYESCKNRFPNVIITRDKISSHTVSNGLGWVAVSDSNLIVCHDAAKRKIGENAECSVVSLRRNVSNALFNKLSDIVVAQTSKWANASGDNLSVRDLQNSIKAYMGRPDVEKEIMDICRGEIASWKNVLSSSMENAVNEQVAKLYSENVAKGIMIPKDVWVQLQQGALASNNIDITQALNNIDLGGVLNFIAKIIAKIVIWIVVWVLSAETYGLSILGGILASAATDLLLTDDNLDKKRKRSIRLKVAKKIKPKLQEEKSNVMKAFDEDFEKQTEGYDAMIDDTLTKAFEIVTLKRFEL